MFADARLDILKDYGPEELRELAQFVRDAKKSPPVPESPPLEPQEPQMQIQYVDTFVPWDLRLNAWLLSQFGQGSRDGIIGDRGQRLWLPRKMLVWVLLAYPRFRRMLWIITSGRTDEATAAERTGICNDCQHLRIDRKSKPRCGSCRCVDWRLSDLRVKNTFAENHCPERKHPGEYRRLVRYIYPNLPNGVPTEIRRTGCGGPQQQAGG